MRERSLKDEMRNAVRGDRERAEARRKAEAEGSAPTVPPPRPTIDLNRPVAELKRPAPRREPIPEAVSTPEPEPAPTPEPPTPRPEPPPAPPTPEPPKPAARRRSLFARLFRR